MKAVRLGCISLLALLLCVGPAAAKDRDKEREREMGKGPVLGLELGMTREAALDRLGMLEEEEKEALERHGPEGEGFNHESESGEEVWMLPSEPHYASVTVHFGRDGRLEWATAFARAGGKPVRFRELGDLRRARRAGNTIYVWSIPPRGNRRGYQIIARSQNPQIVQSVSITALVGRTDGPGSPRREGR